MIVLALLILLAIVCGYSWLAYRIKTTVPHDEFDQREELHAALGHKMMGSSLMTERAGSNPDRFRYNSEDPSHSTTANRDKYHAAGIAAMDAYGNARIDAGRFPTRQGCIDAAVRGIAAAVIRDRAREVVSKMFDTYIDDATGA